MYEQTVQSSPDKRKKLLKKLLKIVLCLAIICIILYMIPPVRETYWKARVIAYVRLHEDALNNYAESFPLDESKHEKYHGWDVSCFAVLPGDGSRDGPPGTDSGNSNPDSYVIQFDRFGFGLVPSTTYAGMYYSPDDIPSLFQGIPRPTPRGETGKICDHWYWYIAWF